MADERCPLLELGEGLEIPEVCREQCGHLWDVAVRLDIPERDEYEDFKDADEDDLCAHLLAEYSHDNLQVSRNNRAVRFYSVVDMCVDCGIEVGESTYTFICPHS